MNVGEDMYMDEVRYRRLNRWIIEFNRGRNKMKSGVAKTKDSRKDHRPSFSVACGSFNGNRAIVLIIWGGVELDSTVKFVAAARSNAGMACPWSSSAVVVVHIIAIHRCLQWR